LPACGGASRNTLETTGGQPKLRPTRLWSTAATRSGRCDGIELTFAATDDDSAGEHDEIDRRDGLCVASYTDDVAERSAGDSMRLVPSRRSHAGVVDIDRRPHALTARKPGCRTVHCFDFHGTNAVRRGASRIRTKRARPMPRGAARRMRNPYATASQRGTIPLAVVRPAT